jgi:hypothetical protein
MADLFEKSIASGRRRQDALARPSLISMGLNDRAGETAF